MSRTLYGKLSIVLFGLFVLLGAVFICMTIFTYPRYQDEINQKLNRRLAEYFVADKDLFKNGVIARGKLDAAFKTLMHINPNIEAYFLDTSGVILDASLDADKVKRRSVSMGPIISFLRSDSGHAVRGDDPRSFDRQKVFSVAPVFADPPGTRSSKGKPTTESRTQIGYLYLILSGETYDTTVALFQRSYILRLSVALAAASVIFALAAGLLLFFMLTRRLSALLGAMESFRSSGFSDPGAAKALPGDGGDEIARIADTFRQMTVKIVDQIAVLKQTDLLRREFVANVSHDLRTPLAALRGYVETMILKQGSLSADEHRRFLDSANRQTETVEKRIDQLFDLAKLEFDQTPLAREPIFISELVQDLVQKLTILADRRKVSLRTDLGRALPFITGDVGLMERALENLLENAMRFTPEAGEIRITVERNGDRIKVVISDTGSGITEDDLSSTFDQVARASNPPPGLRRRRGLGLAITRRIVDLHGGTLTITSETGHGTVVTVDLPVGESH